MRIILLVMMSPMLLMAQVDLEYQKPSKEILALADFERAPSVILDDNKENVEQLSYKSKKEVHFFGYKSFSLRFSQCFASIQ